MFDAHDKVILEQIVDKIVTARVDRVENKIDKVLKIVTRTDQEHILTKTKVTKLEKRVSKVESNLKIKQPASASVFA